MTDDIVTRLHALIVERLRQAGDDAAPLTVGALYRDVAPYPLARSHAGIDIHADYEHALLRLLAGEGGLLALESEDALQEVLREVHAPFPSAGVLRRLAGRRVRVRPSDEDAGDAPMVEQGEPAGEPAIPAEPPTAPGLLGEQPTTTEPDDAPAAHTPEAGTTEAGTTETDAALDPDAPTPDLDAAPETDAAPQPDSTPEPDSTPDPGATPEPRLRLHRERATGPAGPGPEVHACGTCGEVLPDDRPVNFCPSCGVDQRDPVCPGCGAAMEPDWRYCVTCGHRAGGS